jgi:hypothetical protein
MESERGLAIKIAKNGSLSLLAHTLHSPPAMVEEERVSLDEVDGDGCSGLIAASKTDLSVTNFSSASQVRSEEYYCYPIQT